MFIRGRAMLLCRMVQTQFLGESIGHRFRPWVSQSRLFLDPLAYVACCWGFPARRDLLDESATLKNARNIRTKSAEVYKLAVSMLKNLEKKT